jgi:hypothetical protein|eukprot:g3833.t1
MISLVAIGYAFKYKNTMWYHPFWVTAVCLYLRSSIGGRVAEESLLVTQKLGVQIERVFFSGRRSYEFVDMHSVDDAIINEGITRCKVIYYMAFLLSNRKDPLLVFQNSPPLKKLQLICHGTRDVLGLEMSS